MCVRLPHACQRFVNLSMRNAIYTFGKKYTRWEAFFPGKFVPVLTFRADCSLVTSKPAHLSPYLPVTVLGGLPQKLALWLGGVRHRGLDGAEGNNR
jgi:hypothetical protein